MKPDTAQLLAEFERYRAEEAAAIQALDAAVARGGANMAEVLQLTQKMLHAHNRAMAVYFRLLQRKLEP